MPNITIYTGLLTYELLEQYDLDTGISTGVVKPNISTDPDFIPGLVSDQCPTRITRWIPGEFRCEEDAGFSLGFNLGFNS